MAIILSEEASNAIKKIRKSFDKYADKGWMCEGGEHQRGDGSWLPCNVIFNNDTDEFFRADYNGNILYNGLVSTSIEDAQDMAKIQGKIREALNNYGRHF